MCKIGDRYHTEVLHSVSHLDLYKMLVLERVREEIKHALPVFNKCCLGRYRK